MDRGFVIAFSTRKGHDLRSSGGPAGWVLAFASLAVLVILGISHVSQSEAAVQGAALPDGRVYEQVSPPEKAGASVTGNLKLVQSSPDGGRLAFFSEPTLPGSEGAGSLGTYLSTREPENWITQGLLPSAMLGREGTIAGSSADFKYSYVGVKVPGVGRNYYRRNNNTRASTLMFSTERARLIPVATSSDDARLLFELKAKLLPEASEENDVYLWDSATGNVSLASAMNTGEAPVEGAFAGPYGWPEGGTFGGGTAASMYTSGAFTEDGSGAYFTTAGPAQLYLRRNILQPQSTLTASGDCEQAEKACTIQVSKSQASMTDPNGEKPAAFLAATSSGPSVVFFASSGKLTNDATTGPSDEGLDFYRYDSASGQLVDLIPDPAALNGAEFRGLLGISAEGTRAYFMANGVVGNGAARGATQGNCTLPPTPRTGEPSGKCNLYLWEEGEGLRYIATLNADGPVYASSTEASLSDASNWVTSAEQGVEPTARVSEDAGILVFRSQEQLTESPTEGIPQFYRYQVGDNRLSCITCSSTSGEERSLPTLFNIESFMSIFSPPTLTRNLSADGGRFVFQTAAALVPEDVNGASGCPDVRQPFSSVPNCQDVYEWETPGEGSCTEASSAFRPANEGCLYLLSTGVSDEPSFIADADSSAANVFFFTSQQLVTQDRDQLVDVYDARVGGGLTAQLEGVAEACTGILACRGGSSGGGGESQSSQSTTAPAETTTKAVRCNKGLRKRKKRGKTVCAKPAKHHKGKHHRKRQKHHEAGHQPEHKSRLPHKVSKGKGK
jgi:hypothetical protein